PLIMRTAAHLHADEARRQLGEQRQHLLASEPPDNDDLALRIDAVDLEYLLCKVEPNGGDCWRGRPPLVIRHQRSLCGTQMPRGVSSTSSNSAAAGGSQGPARQLTPEGCRSRPQLVSWPGITGERCFGPQVSRGRVSDVVQSDAML